MPPPSAKSSARRAPTPAVTNGHEVTAEDVAAALGLSATTVRRALRGSPVVRPETRERVERAARELGFQSNWIARSLSTRSSTFIGMVVPDVAHPFFGDAIEGAQDAIEEAGYQLLMVSSRRDADREAAGIRSLLAHRVAGILVNTISGMERCGVPVVFFDNLDRSSGSGFAHLDDRGGIELLVTHLLEEHGHRRIAYLGGPRDIGTAEARREAFQTTLARAWLAVPPEYLRVGDAVWSAESGARETDALLALDPPPTAIVAGTDTLAEGALRALHAAGRRIPEDVALVSFNDPPLGYLLDPPLTALTSHGRELGAQAAGVLLRHLAGASAVEEVVIPAELIARRSCGCG